MTGWQDFWQVGGTGRMKSRMTGWQDYWQVGRSRTHRTGRLAR